MTAVTAYLNRLALAGYRPGTIAVRERCLRAFAAHIEPDSIVHATRQQIEDYLARPLAPESRRAYRAHLRGFYAYLVDEGLLGADPTAKVPAIRVPRAAPRPISGDHLALALNHATPRMRAWLLLMSLAGLRCMEVAALRPGDVLAAEGGPLLYLRECKGGGSATVVARDRRDRARAQAHSCDGLVSRERPRHHHDRCASQTCEHPDRADVRADGPDSAGRGRTVGHPSRLTERFRPMRRFLVLPLLVLIAACAGGSSSSDEPSPAQSSQDSAAEDCGVMRRSIERDKFALNEARRAGDSVETEKQSRELQLDAQAARSITGCDITDLVGPGVGQ